MRSIAGLPQEPRNPHRNGRKNEDLRSQIGATRSVCSSALLSRRPRSGTHSGRQRKGPSTGLDATKDLSPAQWNFKSAPERWSVAECIEHIAAAEDFIRGMIVEKVMIAPAVPDRDIAVVDAGILTGVPDRTTKVRALDPLKPTNRFASPQGSIDHFVESRAKTEEFLKNTPGLRDHAVNSPVGTKWDAYESILLIGAAQRTPHQANSRRQSRSQLPQILITASGRRAALCSGKIHRALLVSSSVVAFVAAALCGEASLGYHPICHPERSGGSWLD